MTCRKDKQPGIVNLEGRVIDHVTNKIFSDIPSFVVNSTSLALLDWMKDSETIMGV